MIILASNVKYKSQAKEFLEKGAKESSVMLRYLNFARKVSISNIGTKTG